VSSLHVPKFDLSQFVAQRSSHSSDARERSGNDFSKGLLRDFTCLGREPVFDLEISPPVAVPLHSMVILDPQVERNFFKP
jgi:hypothetical protein